MPEDEKSCDGKGDKPCCHGPGYSSPMDAMKNGPMEKLLYVTCPSPSSDKPDMLATVDVDPASKTYGKIIHRLKMLHIGDELHQSGWNSCSSCYNNPEEKRSHLILPGLNSDRLYIVDVATDERAPRMFKVIEPEEVHEKCNASMPHSPHCLPSGEAMISVIGDNDGNAKGGFLVVDTKDWTLKGNWEKKPATLGYDFWYQPRHNVMISTELSPPWVFRSGYNPEHFAKGYYGQGLNIWNWTTKELIKRIDLGKEGSVPLTIRFLHDPDEAQGYVACGVSSTIWRFFKTNEGTWNAEKVIDVPNKKIENGLEPELIGFPGTIIISLDDRFLYFSNWLHGDVRQYDVSDRRHPKLVGQIFLGGMICIDSKVKVIEDKELKEQPDPLIMNGKRVQGGPQTLQLSLDGKRLYITTSAYVTWDRQFYPDLVRDGAVLLLVDVNTESGGLTLNEKFHVDFGEGPDGPYLAHQMRYPGGDCSSDIWI